MLFPSHQGHAEVKVHFSSEALNCAGEDSPLAALILAVRTAVADFDQAMAREAATLSRSEDLAAEGKSLLKIDDPAAVPGFACPCGRPPSTIGLAIASARRSILRLMAAKVGAKGITHNEYCMLRTLSHDAPTALCELARTMGLDCPTVSRTVKQLSARGYLTGRRDPVHRRRIIIQLTPEGDRLTEELNRIDADLQESAQKGLRAEDLLVMQQVLAKYIHNLDQLVTTDSPVMAHRSSRSRESRDHQAMA